MHNMSAPSSPDPTPLRMLAFSVAESALQSDPNSPMFNMLGKVPSPPRVRANGWVPPVPHAPTVNDRWTTFDDGRRGKFTPPTSAGASIAQRRGKELWNVAGRAMDRRANRELARERYIVWNAHITASYILDTPVLPASPPASPGYSFTLPPNSPLAESIAADVSPSTKPRLAALAALDISLPHQGMYTRSAEPSPIYSTFSGLDQSRPPPEFVPRLTAQEFSVKSSKIAATTKARHARTQSDADSPDLVSPVGAVFPVHPHLPGRVSRHTQRLPSLQQIQAKMKRAHRRTGSAGSVPGPIPAPTTVPELSPPRQATALPIDVSSHRPSSVRTASDDSVEMIQTPEDDVANPLRDRRLVLQTIMNRRPATPPSPSGKERLLPFLRERTSDRHRLAIVKGEMANTAVSSNNTGKPSLRVIPPTLESRPAVPPLVFASEALSPTRPGFFRRTTSPTQLRFNPPPRLATPPTIRTVSAGSMYRPSTPISPTSSIRSRSATGSPGGGSPTMNMPIITCTPAPALVLRDGVEQDSDDETEADVVVFDGEAEEREREERERRGIEMRAKLGLRRRSIESM